MKSIPSPSKQPQRHSLHYSPRKPSILQVPPLLSSVSQRPIPSKIPIQSSSTLSFASSSRIQKSQIKNSVSGWQLQQKKMIYSEMLQNGGQTQLIHPKLYQSTELRNSHFRTGRPNKNSNIKFSYLPVNTSRSTAIEFVDKFRKEDKQLTKGTKNNLSPRQVQFAYRPPKKLTRSIQEIQKTNKELEELLFQLMEQSNRLTSKTSIFSNRDSKLTDTTIGEPKDSILQVSPQKNNLSHRTHLNSLADCLPSSKRLDKTIMLNCNYNFGGLIPTNTLPEKRQYEKERVGWKDVRGLLSEQEMKESIHCGPEERGVGWECSMLSGLGREIKDSVISLKE